MSLIMELIKAKIAKIVDRKKAKKMGMTVEEYREYLKEKWRKKKEEQPLWDKIGAYLCLVIIIIFLTVAISISLSK